MSRAERRLCKKIGHPYAKVMPDGSIVCALCAVVVKPAPAAAGGDQDA